MRNAFALALARLLSLGAVALLASCASTTESAADLAARASKAMGADELRTLRYSGDGTGYTFGQAFVPEGAWPRIVLHSMTRSIDYASGAMRDEIVLSRAEPQGGGGYPLSGQQRNDQYISGEIAWNQTPTAAAPGPRFVTDRVHQLWITPHGALKAAQRNGASVRSGDGGTRGLAFTQPGRFSATVWIGADGFVSQVDSLFADPVLGDTRAVTTYSDYRDFSGVRFPTRVRQSIAGFPVLDLQVRDVQPNAAVSLAVPDAARDQGERVTADKVADGVWFIGGGTHNSVAIELADHVVLVETPLNDARTQAVIDRVKQIAPGKPIRHAINSHQHFDHAGGLRAAVAEGATIVTQAANVPYFERVFAQPSSIRPDRMAQAGRRPSFLAVRDRLDLGDATQPIQVHRIAGGPHAEAFVMVYLPKDKLLIEADAYTPGPPNAPPPPVPNANNVNLVANIERLNLAVDRILPLHGRVVPLAELYTAVGKTPPAR
ncbi:MAG TPA: MBL fold metallo-hydrolase [Caldimonas sp.]|jgi:glyoxylase-like metal-dependent hydrolase (beta-lactamase superfamily II)|nr:MBL fold metallo-hydrolase [Caldimonas sp.]HEX2541346.1 MBL fold metallo-hydrolase [Caldimonas sp.]